MPPTPNMPKYHHTTEQQQPKIRWFRDDRGTETGTRSANWQLAKVATPHSVVIGVDLIIIVPVGHEGVAGLAQRLSPQHKVGGVDSAATVEVAGHSCQHIDVLSDPGHGRIIEHTDRKSGIRGVEDDDDGLGI